MRSWYEGIVPIATHQPFRATDACVWLLRDGTPCLSFLTIAASVPSATTWKTTKFVHIFPTSSSLFSFPFFYSASSFHSSIDGFPQIPVKIGKNCDLQSRHRSLYHLDLVSICIQSRFEAIILGMISWKKYSTLREDEGNMSNYFEKYLWVVMNFPGIWWVKWSIWSITIDIIVSNTYFIKNRFFLVIIPRS